MQGSPVDRKSNRGWGCHSDVLCVGRSASRDGMSRGGGGMFSMPRILSRAHGSVRLPMCPIMDRRWGMSSSANIARSAG